MKHAMVNANLVRRELAQLPVDDRGLLFGEGINTAVRVYNAIPAKLERHLDALAEALALPETGITHALNYSQIARDISTLCSREELHDCIASINITPGCKNNDAPSLLHRNEANTLILIDKIPENIETWQEQGMRLTRSSVRRIKGDGMARFKYTFRHQCSISRREAMLRGYDDGLITDQDGSLLSTSNANIFAVVGGGLITPHPKKDGVVTGITREVVLECAAREGIIVYQESLTPEVIKRADEIFLTSSTLEIMPVANIDETKVIGDFPMSKKLLGLYRERITCGQ